MIYAIRNRYMKLGESNIFIRNFMSGKIRKYADEFISVAKADFESSLLFFKTICIPRHCISYNPRLKN